MAFFRIKKIKGKEYTYLVENEWKRKGSRQKVKGYLGRIYRFDLKNKNSFIEFVKNDDLEKYIEESIAIVKGDFRQKEILKEWDNVLSKTTLNEFSIISIKISCTSGTYMRSLANTIGEKIGIPALALNIKRTKVGGGINYKNHLLMKRFL